MAVDRPHNRDACERATFSLSDKARWRPCASEKRRANQKYCHNDSEAAMLHLSVLRPLERSDEWMPSNNGWTPDGILSEEGRSLSDTNASKSAIVLPIFVTAAWSRW
jgi:hypothetical protein